MHHEDEWLSVAILVATLLCTLISDRWWRGARIAMFEPKRYALMRSIVRAQRLMGKARDSDKHRSAEMDAMRTELTRLESQPLSPKLFVVQRCLPIILYLCIRLSPMIPIARLYPNKELVVIPEYYLQGLPQRLMYGDTLIALLERICAAVMFGELPQGSTDVMGFQLIWLRSLGVVGWSLVCHVASSVVSRVISIDRVY